MNPPLWVFAGAVVLFEAATPTIEGDIALAMPGCGFFAVKTLAGFSLLDQRDYHSVFEGDRVRGLLHSPGARDVEVVGEITISATIEEWAVTHAQAVRAFHRRCKTRPPVNHDLD